MDSLNRIQKKLLPFRIWLLRPKLIKALVAHLIIIYYRLFHSRRKFLFQRKKISYFYHPYNYTWLGERTVEIPVIWELVKNCQAQKILEIGNVLGHYFHFPHEVIDKYEKSAGVINQDITDFKTDKKYDLIVSVSTLEHIGWDEYPRQRKKFLRAYEKLKKLLSPGGKIIISLPLGYNPEVDQTIKKGLFRFSRQFYLKRISPKNLWRQVNQKAIIQTRYNFPFYAANVLLIGIYSSPRKKYRKKTKTYSYRHKDSHN